MTGGSGYCECGCGQRTNIAPQTRTDRGWVRGRPMHFIAGHQRRQEPVPFIVDPETGCWNWQRATNHGGYGRISRKGCHETLAHRFFYQQLVGPIPDELTLDHLCENPPCINPAHLEPVPIGVNSLRSAATLVGQNVRKTHCPYGHPYDDENTYRNPRGDRECRICKRDRLREFYVRQRAA